MRNVTPVLARKNECDQDDRGWSLPGGIIGFVCYWLSLAVPYLLYGSNTLFFLLYTWPFFLALLPLAVLIGIAWNLLLRGQWLWTLLATLSSVICCFWLLFLWLTGW